jgi:hypothetical protein
MDSDFRGETAVLLGLIQEFVSLSESAPRGAELARAKLLMAELRRYGFTSVEISELSGGKWGDGSVRLYTREPPWGDVVEVKRLEKEREMGILRRFAKSGLTFEDVDATLKLEEMAKSRETTLLEVAELWHNMMKVPVEKGEVGMLVDTARLLLKRGMTPAEMDMRIEFDDMLFADGLTPAIRKKLVELSIRHGGLAAVLAGFTRYVTLLDIDKLIRLAEEELNKYVALSGQEHATFEYYKEANKSVDALLKAGFNLEIIIALPYVIRKADTVDNLQLAVGKARSIQELMALNEMYKAINAQREEMLRGFSPEQRAEFEKYLTLTTKPLPETRTSEYSMLAIVVFENYISAAMKDPEVSQETKSVMAKLQSDKLELVKILFPQEFNAYAGGSIDLNFPGKP